MKRIIALLTLALLTLTTPAFAGGPKVDPLPWTPVAPVTAPGACPGVTSKLPAKEWDFSEVSGSHGPFKEMNGNPADDLALYSYGGTATGNGTSVGFADGAIVKTAGNIFSPENADFVMCTGFQVTDLDGYNLTQINNSYVTPANHGMIKQVGWYSQFGGTQNWFQVHNTTGSPPHQVKGTELNGTGWHTVTSWRHGNVYSTYFDGVFSDSKTMAGIGPVHLDAPLVVGGKFLEGGGTVTSVDLLNGRVAWVKLG